MLATLASSARVTLAPQWYLTQRAQAMTNAELGLPTHLLTCFGEKTCVALA